MTFLGGPQSNYLYPALITSITDGDTIGAQITLVEADLGFGVTINEVRNEKRWRLASINAPELGTPQGAAAADHLAALLGAPLRPDPWKHDGNPYVLATLVRCSIVTSKDRPDNYGRILATIVTPEGMNVNERMIQDGFAQPWPAKVPA